MGKKFAGMPVRAAVGHVDALSQNSRADELPSRRFPQIHQTFSVGAPAEGGFGAEDAGELVEHLRPHLERVPADARPDRGNTVRRFAVDFSNLMQGCRDDPGHDAAPPGVHRCHNPPIAAGDQHRHAIRHPNGSHARRVIAHNRIGLGGIVKHFAAAHANDV
ncbi:MAG: hypothetical protein JWM97_1702 [Phycisphaerales bacterium]|nr:hypothetical protein [Phycisphaerales bacterium]